MITLPGPGEGTTGAGPAAQGNRRRNNQTNGGRASTASGEDHERPAMRAVPVNRYLTFFTMAVVGCALDLATKAWAFAELGRPGGPTCWIWRPYFGWQTSLNQGALFGMGQGKVGVFAALSVAAAIGIVYWLFVSGAAVDRLLTVALGAVMAGILGNLYDRLGLWSMPGNPGQRYHAVRDWILVQYPPWTWPNFNLADSFLVCGAALLMWHAFRSHPKDPKGELAASGVQAERR